MSRQTILNTLRGLKKSSSIRTEPIATPKITDEVTSTGPGSVSVATDVPEINLPELNAGYSKLPEGATPTGIEYNNPADLARTHPETYEAMAGTREAGRARGVDKLITKLSAATEATDPNNIMGRAMQGEDLASLTEQAGKSNQLLDKVNRDVRVNLLRSYLDNRGIKTGRNTTGADLLASAKAGDGGLGDRIARRQQRRVHDEQIAANETYDMNQRLVGLVRAGIDETSINTRFGGTQNSTAETLQALSGQNKTKAANITLGMLERTLLTGKTAERVGLGKRVSGIARTTVSQALGRKLVQKMPELRPKDNWMVDGKRYKDLKGDDKYRADKKWQINLANTMLERATRDGTLIEPYYNTHTAMERSKYMTLNSIRQRKVPEDARIPLTKADVENGLGNDTLATKLGYKDAQDMQRDYHNLSQKYESGNWDQWELKPTKLFADAMKGFSDVEKTGVMPNFSGSPTVSKNANDVITMRADLDEDLLHLSPKEFNNKSAPIYFDAVNHLQNTHWTIDMDIIDELEGLATRPNNGITPHISSPEELALSYKSDPIKMQNAAAKEADKKKVYDETIQYGRIFHGRGPFHLDVWSDFRGRLGYRSAYVNPQGDPVSRSILSLAQEQRVSTTQAWEDDVVNEMLSYWGPSKDMTPNQRLQYFETNKDYLIDLGANWNAGYDKWAGQVKTKDALPFLKAAKELYRKHRLGAETSGYLTGLDAVTSQAQMLSAAFRDESLAPYVALTQDVVDDDLYKLAARDTYSKIRADRGNPNADFWLHPDVQPLARSVFKRPIMTDTYNAGKETMAKQLVDDAPGFPAPSDTTNPLKRIELEQAEYLINKMVDVIRDPSTEAGNIFKAVTQIKDITKKAAKKLVYDTGRKVVTKDGKQYPELDYLTKPGQSFKGSSGFPFRQHYRSTRPERVRSRSYEPNKETGIYEANLQSSFGYRMPLAQPRNDMVNKFSTSFAPNTIHHWDADVLHHTVKYLKEQDIPTATVHDQFFVPAGYSGELRKAYVKALQTVFKGDRLKEQLMQILPKSDVEDLLKDTTKGELDLDKLDNMLENYWKEGVSPINVG